MNNEYQSLLNDLNFHTELLESVGWCEEKLESMIAYLQEKMSQEDVSTKSVLHSVKEKYGENAHRLLKEMFNKIYIENGLYKVVGKNDEH